MFEKLLVGGRLYKAWMLLLLVIIGAGVVCYLIQFFYGLGITGMSRDVSWGLYLANFTFFVGVAASAVMVVLPYYLHNYKAFGKLTTFGEFLAVSAVLMCILFVTLDLGQPTRILNIILHPSPNSILFWDVVVLSTYLVLNLIIAWHILNAHRHGEKPKPWAKWLILISIPVAISIHTVTAFIYSGLGARTFWLTALMAPRFLASAFASGPALLILLCLIMKRYAGFDPGKDAIRKLSQIVTYALIITVFFFVVEIFTVYYSQLPEHMVYFNYLLFGIDGHNALVPWMWTTIVFWIAAVALLLIPRTLNKEKILIIAMVLVFIAMWIDKGMALMIPAFIPSPLGAITEYFPTAPEVFITLGVWGIGFFVLTVFYKLTLAVNEEVGDEDAAH